MATIREYNDRIVAVLLEASEDLDPIRLAELHIRTEQILQAMLRPIRQLQPTIMRKLTDYYAQELTKIEEELTDYYAR